MCGEGPACPGAAAHGVVPGGDRGRWPCPPPPPAWGASHIPGLGLGLVLFGEKETPSGDLGDNGVPLP